MNRTAAPFYKTGGTLDPADPSYVERPADTELYEALLRGEYCTILDARQMGKSSLMARTVLRLRQNGVAAAALDLQRLGNNLSPEAWYEGLLDLVGEGLGLSVELAEYWDANERMSPLRRWISALRHVALPRLDDGRRGDRGDGETGRPESPIHPLAPSPRRLGRPVASVVIFIDEIDTVQSLPFSTDEFFAGIRECYNRRGQEPELNRLVFCLLGVATPADLIRDTRATPFNIGRRIALNDFTVAEAAPLAEGLVRRGSVAPGDAAGLGATDAGALLKRALYWTGGHPYLTQRLCQALAEDPSKTGSEGVDQLCQELFLAPRASDRDSNLTFVRERLLRGEVDRTSLLDLYAQVRSGRRVRDNGTNALVSTLWLSGIVRTEDGSLRVRNRIYDRVFDPAWIAAQRSHAPESPRQRAPEVGLLREATETKAQTARRLRRQLSEREVERGARLLAEGNPLGLLDLLAARRTLNDLPEAIATSAALWAEWDRVWPGQLAHVVGHSGPVTAVAFSPNGALLATGSSDRKVQLWDTATGAPQGEPIEHPAAVAAVAFSPDGRLLATASAETLWLRQMGTGQPYGEAIVHGHPIRAVQFSPDGKLLAIASQDGSVRLYTTTSRQPAGRRLEHEAPVQAVAFGPDGKLLATAAGDTVRLRKTATGEPCRQELRHDGPVLAVAFSPDGKLLATGSRDATARLWDVATGESQGHPLRHEGGVTSVAFSPDQKLLATASLDGAARMWKIATEEPFGPPLRHQGAVLAVAFSPRGDILATGSRDHTARLWHRPGAPPDVREMELRVWLSLGARLDAQGNAEAIPWREWQRLRAELQALEGERTASQGGIGGRAPVSRFRTLPGWRGHSRTTGPRFRKRASRTAALLRSLVTHPLMSLSGALLGGGVMAGLTALMASAWDRASWGPWRYLPDQAPSHAGAAAVIGAIVGALLMLRLTGAYNAGSLDVPTGKRSARHGALVGLTLGGLGMALFVGLQLHPALIVAAVGPALLGACLGALYCRQSPDPGRAVAVVALSWGLLGMAFELGTGFFSGAIQKLLGGFDGGGLDTASRLYAPRVLVGTGAVIGALIGAAVGALVGGRSATESERDRGEPPPRRLHQ